MPADLRAPDPMLTALPDRTAVEVEEAPVPVAHLSATCGYDDRYQHSLQDAEHARWFAVPCRECFPDAPEPGHEFHWIKRQDDRLRRAQRSTKHLAWQVPDREVSDVR